MSNDDMDTVEQYNNELNTVEEYLIDLVAHYPSTKAWECWPAFERGTWVQALWPPDAKFTFDDLRDALEIVSNFFPHRMPTLPEIALCASLCHEYGKDALKKGSLRWHKMFAKDDQTWPKEPFAATMTRAVMLAYSETRLGRAADRLRLR